MFRKSIAVFAALMLMLGVFTGCMKKADNNKDDGPGSTVKEIRYLNFKPEIARVYDDIAAAYEEETGVKLIVETAASGTYESTLTARMATDIIENTNISHITVKIPAKTLFLNMSATRAASLVMGFHVFFHVLTIILKTSL